MRRTYERMDRAIAESGGPWLLGKDITLADVAVMPAIVRMADLGLDTMWEDMPRVARWYDEIRAHAGVQADLLSGLAADGAVSAPEGAGGEPSVARAEIFEAGIKPRI